MLLHSHIPVRLPLPRLVGFAPLLNPTHVTSPMRLSLILTTCLLLGLWLNCAHADEPYDVAGVSSGLLQDFGSDPLEWRNHEAMVRQLLTPSPMDFDKVGYRIGAFDVLNAPSNVPLIPEPTSVTSPGFGFGSQTLNFIRTSQELAPTVPEPATGIEQAHFQESLPPAQEPVLGWDMQTPEQVFDPPVDPTIREYKAGDWKDAIPKTLWQEYCDWFQNGFGSWTERLELGGAFLEGNTNQEVFNTAAKFSKETKLVTTVINFGGNHAQSKMSTTANRWFADTTTDFKREGNWLYFVRSLHEYDQFTNLDYRGTASFGSGYRFFNEENKKLIIRYGPGVTQEVFHSPRLVRTSPDLFGEVEMKWLLGPRVVFEEKATVHPNITNFGMLRVLNTTGFLIPLDSQKRWNLKVGFRYEYNGRPNAGRQSSDFATNVNIVYSRK
jgi:putative salt-induced outer membrane protein YdiY